MPAPAPPLVPDEALPDLLARCRRREPAAQRALYNRFAGPMLALARQYAPSVPDAEDALQEAFIKAFQRLDEQRVPGAFAGWLRQIVVRTSLDGWQRRQVRRVEFDLTEAHHLPSPDASVLDQLTLAEVRALIDHLPDGCRLVLLLYTVEGYAHAEIGQLLGISERASTVQLTRARHRLAALVRAQQRERQPRAPATGLATGQSAAAPGPDTAPFHPLSALLFQ